METASLVLLCSSLVMFVVSGIMCAIAVYKAREVLQFKAEIVEALRIKLSRPTGRRLRK